jgi:hypothetical protein
MWSLTSDKNSWMRKIDPVLTTVIVITPDLTRRFESEFFEVSNFHSGFILQHFDFTQVFTVFTFHYFSLDQKPKFEKTKRHLLYLQIKFFHIFF